MQPAPFHADVADAPSEAEVFFLHCADGVQIRVGAFARAAGRNGTVLLFPGRTEYIEKYGRAAQDFATRGFATLVIDWRGQGLSDRLTEDPNTGHVAKFSDYQHDVQAMFEAARALGLPEPVYLCAHSMGGCIGLRALHNGLEVRASAFSAPMWGLQLSVPERILAWSISWSARQISLSHLLTPGTKSAAYQDVAPFEGNVLTGDAEMFAYMRTQSQSHPELIIGGPSLHWLHEALVEMKTLSRMTSPETPTFTALGTLEQVVDPDRIVQRMQRWPEGTLLSFAGAEHEVMMETPGHRGLFFDSAAGLFVAHP